MTLEISKLPLFERRMPHHLLEAEGVQCRVVYRDWTLPARAAQAEVSESSESVIQLAIGDLSCITDVNTRFTSGNMCMSDIEEFFVFISDTKKNSMVNP